MSLTIAEWEEEFAKLTLEQREHIRRSLDTLEYTPVFKEQFGWTGLFALKYSIDAVNEKEKREG